MKKNTGINSLTLTLPELGSGERRFPLLPDVGSIQRRATPYSLYVVYFSDGRLKVGITGNVRQPAAKHAASTKASAERIAIRQALEQVEPSSYGLTAREIAASTGIDYIEVQRRISEVAGIERSGERRDGCAVWRLS